MLALQVTLVLELQVTLVLTLQVILVLALQVTGVGTTGDSGVDTSDSGVGKSIIHSGIIEMVDDSGVHGSTFGSISDLVTGQPSGDKG